MHHIRDPVTGRIVGQCLTQRTINESDLRNQNVVFIEGKQAENYKIPQSTNKSTNHFLRQNSQLENQHHNKRYCKPKDLAVLKSNKITSKSSMINRSTPPNLYYNSNKNGYYEVIDTPYQSRNYFNRSHFYCDPFLCQNIPSQSNNQKILDTYRHFPTNVYPSYYPPRYCSNYNLENYNDVKRCRNLQTYQKKFQQDHVNFPSLEQLPTFDNQIQEIEQNKVYREYGNIGYKTSKTESTLCCIL